MTSFPFFRSPFYNNYYNPYYHSHLEEEQINSSNTSCENVVEDKFSESNSSSSHEEKSSRYYSFGPVNFKNPIFSDIEEPIFEIFGIQLYLDDIIILGLLFFLYQEGVEDDMLFISLILLLLS